MPPNSALARRFRELIANEPSQWVVAQKIGCTQSYVGQIARGQSHPSRELVERIIAAYDLPRDEWLDLGGYGKNPAPDPLTDIREELARIRHLVESGQSDADPSDLASRLLNAVDEEGGDALPPLQYEPDFSGEAMHGLTGDLSPAARRRMEAALRVLHAAELRRRGAGE